MEVLHMSSEDSSLESPEISSPTPPIIYHTNIPVCCEVEIGKCSISESPTHSANTSSPEEQTSKNNTGAPSVLVRSPQVQLKPEISTLVFFDLETTGLGRFIGNKNVHITEISMIAVSKLDFLNSEVADLSDIRVVNKLSLCIKPRTRVSMDAAKITGLNDSNLFRQHQFDESCGHMINSFIMRLPQPACLLAHNGNIFDFPLLKSELFRIGISLPVDLFAADTLYGIKAVGIISDPNTDSKGTALKPKKGGRKRWSYRLESLYCHYFRQRPKMSHSSEGDCKALMMVCNKMKDQLLPWIEKNKKCFNSFPPMW